MLKKISDIYTEYKNYIILIITGVAAYALLEMVGFFEREFEQIIYINYLTCTIYLSLLAYLFPFQYLCPTTPMTNTEFKD